MNALAALARGSIFGLAAFALVTRALLACGTAVPPWLFPLVLGLLLLVTARRPRPALDPAPLDIAVLAILAVVLVALCYGSVATASREWDGYVAWGLKARVLDGPASLREAFFSDPLVDAHSRDYPLLQPLCQASLAHWLGDAGGRLLFPALWLVLCGLALRSCAFAGLAPVARAITCVGAALMPGLVSPGGGSVDSGYAELFVATALTGVATGLVTRDHALVVASTVVAALVKPEGPAHAGLVVLAVLLARWPRLLWPGLAIVGLGIAGLALAPHFTAKAPALAFERLPEVLLREVLELASVKRYGFAWVLVVALAFVPRSRIGACPTPALGWLVLGGLLLAPVPFVVWPDITVEHHLRSSMPRLLLHWAVPAWLLGTTWLRRIDELGTQSAARRETLVP